MSKALIGVNRGECRAIVAESVVRNEPCGITGVLWFDGISFAQVLEGGHAAIDETMQRIQADKRHKDIEIVGDREIRHKMFGRWSMAWPDDGPEVAGSTAFLIGFARGQRSEAARRLYEIAIASDDFI